MAPAKPLLWLLPGFAFIAVTLGVAAARGEAFTALQRRFVWSWVAAAVALGIAMVTVAEGRGVMGIEARWERAVLRCLMLNSVALDVLACFTALHLVADMLQLGAGTNHACAALAVAVHLGLAWLAVFGV